MMDESDEDREQRLLLTWIRERGGSVTVRDLTHGLRRFCGKGDAARSALDELAEAGCGRLTHPRPGAKGGRSRAHFETVTVTKIPATDPMAGGFPVFQSSPTCLSIPPALCDGI